MINHNPLKLNASVLTVWWRHVGRLLRDVSMFQVSDTTPMSHTKTVISFQLSNCAPKGNVWSVEDYTYKERSPGQMVHYEPSTLGSFEFGLTHHQVHKLTNFNHIR